MSRFLITAALPYSNGRLHVGHIAGAYLPADTYVRYLRSKGHEVRFICGSDDNGVAALIAARKEGKTVEELTAHYNARQKADFEGLGIEFDIYGGTHQPDYVAVHERLSQEFFKAIYDKGFFVKRTTSQLYDPEAKQFLPDRYVKGTCYNLKEDGTVCGSPEAYGDQCEQCGAQIDPLKLVNPISTITNTTPEPRETSHWYLQLQKLEEKLKAWLEGKRGEWRDTVVNFTLGQIKKGLPERAMTRDLTWGVPVPLDDPDAKGKSLYVWFDAPIGYVSFTAKLADDWERWWKDSDCSIVHFIGEDNIVFHALTWPAMLMAEGTYQRPHEVVANSFLNIRMPGKEEEKISKSRGTAIWIEEFLKMFDPDPLRFYLTAIAPETRRTAFDVDKFVTTNNSELVNTLGNFVNRTMTFVHRYFEGKVPEKGDLKGIDNAFKGKIFDSPGRVDEYLAGRKFRTGLGAMMQLARDANKYFEDNEPWKTRKSDPARCGTTLYWCVQAIRTLATIMEPYLPHSAEKCAKMLRLGGPFVWDKATEEVPAGTELGEAEILFRKIDPEKTFAG